MKPLAAALLCCACAHALAGCAATPSREAMRYDVTGRPIPIVKLKPQPVRYDVTGRVVVPQPMDPYLARIEREALDSYPNADVSDVRAILAERQALRDLAAIRDALEDD